MFTSEEGNLTLLIASDIPGLLGALDNEIGAAHLMMLHDARDILRYIRTTQGGFEALVLRDTIAPLPGQDVYTSLWDVIAACRDAHLLTPVLLLVDPSTPEAIQAALREVVQESGGDLLLLPRDLVDANAPEVQNAVTWLLERLPQQHLPQTRLLLALGTAGGVGTTTAALHMCFSMVQRGLRVLVAGVSMADPCFEALFEATAGANEQRLARAYSLRLDSVSAVQGQIVRHPSGIDLLGHFALCNSDAIGDTPSHTHYDVVFLDMELGCLLGSIAGLLAAPNASAVLVCGPGRHEVARTIAVLETVAAHQQEHADTIQPCVLFREGERGLQAQTAERQREVKKHFPDIIDLGVLPRDPSLVMLAADYGCSVFDIGPQRRYSRAIRTATDRWLAVVGLDSVLAKPERPGRTRRSNGELLMSQERGS